MRLCPYKSVWISVTDVLHITCIFAYGFCPHAKEHKQVFCDAIRRGEIPEYISIVSVLKGIVYKCGKLHFFLNVMKKKKKRGAAKELFSCFTEELSHTMMRV